MHIPAQPNMGTVGIYDSENELLDSKDMTGGYAADMSTYPSGQPYVSTTAVYDSERDCFLGKPPIKILSIGVVDPKGVTIPRAPKPAINTVYEGNMYVK